MLRIDVEEQPIARLRAPWATRAVARETQHGIGAIAVIVDEMLAQRPARIAHAAGPSVSRDSA